MTTRRFKTKTSAKAFVERKVPFPFSQSVRARCDNAPDPGRRQFLKVLAIGIAGIGLWQESASAQDNASQNQPLQFEWRVPSAHFETVKKDLAFKGDIAEEKDTKGGALTYIIAGAALLPDLVKTILALRREIKYGGVVVDTRGKKVKIDTDKGLPGGVIIVVSSKGASLYERNEVDDSRGLIDVLTKARK